MSRKKHAGLRAASAAVCLTILAAATTANWAPLSNANLPVSAKTLAELQEERKSNEDKIAEKQKQLDSLQDDLKQKEEYQKTLQEKITLQQENLDIVTEELKRINDSIDETTAAIADTEDEITVMEADIAIGLMSSSCVCARCMFRAMTAWLLHWLVQQISMTFCLNMS